jgi:hypothetical protein
MCRGREQEDGVRVEQQRHHENEGPHAIRASFLKSVAGDPTAKKKAPG